MSTDLLSVDEVAEQLGLHVRTVRSYVREGRLKAVRIGKQYRIAREDLEALTGRPATGGARDEVRRHRHVEVSSIVEIDAISVASANRVTNTVMAAANARRDDDQPLRAQTLYDEERARLKVIIVGSVATTAELLRLIAALVEARV
jgi:excisionase family DNA binding protein